MKSNEMLIFLFVFCVSILEASSSRANGQKSTEVFEKQEVKDDQIEDKFLRYICR